MLTKRTSAVIQGKNNYPAGGTTYPACSPYARLISQPIPHKGSHKTSVTKHGGETFALFPSVCTPGHLLPMSFVYAQVCMSSYILCAHGVPMCAQPLTCDRLVTHLWCGVARLMVCYPVLHIRSRANSCGVTS